VFPKNHTEQQENKVEKQKKRWAKFGDKQQDKLINTQRKA
jgi:hypothetical protein